MAPPTLSYARHPARQSWRARIVIVFAILCAGAALLPLGLRISNAVAAWQQRRADIAHFLRDQKRCALSTTAPTTIVYDDLPAHQREEKLLMGDGTVSSSFVTGRGWSSPDFATLYQSSRNVGPYSPDFFIETPNAMAPLIHALRSHNKATRLVVATVSFNSPLDSISKTQRGHPLVIGVVPIRTVQTIDAILPVVETTVLLRKGGDTSLRMLAAKLDPRDASHAIIPIQIADTKTDLHLWLNDDDTITAWCDAASVVEVQKIPRVLLIDLAPGQPPRKPKKPK